MYSPFYCVFCRDPAVFGGLRLLAKTVESEVKHLEFGFCGSTSLQAKLQLHLLTCNIMEPLQREPPKKSEPKALQTGPSILAFLLCEIDAVKPNTLQFDPIRSWPTTPCPVPNKTPPHMNEAKVKRTNIFQNLLQGSKVKGQSMHASSNVPHQGSQHKRGPETCSVYACVQHARHMPWKRWTELASEGKKVKMQCKARRTLIIICFTRKLFSSCRRHYPQ